jgi:hypothetical protein
MHSAGDVRGSRLFSHLVAGPMIRRRLRGGGTHAKAAPLQALGNGTSYERANPVEDEYEYEEDLAATSPG